MWQFETARILGPFVCTTVFYSCQSGLDRSSRFIMFWLLSVPVVLVTMCYYINIILRARPGGFLLEYYATSECVTNKL